MPKRKRSEYLEPSKDSSRSTNTPFARPKKLCSQRITAAQKPLVAALRLGAGFERQKHSRRKKTAQAKNDLKAVARLDAEYAVLKGLDLAAIADQHIRRTIGRVKSLKEHEALGDYMGSNVKGEHDPATLNVLARLYKVPAVKKVVDEVIEDLKNIVGTGQATQSDGRSIGAKSTSRKDQKISLESEMEAEIEDDEDAFAAFDMRIAAPSSGDEESEASISGDNRPPSVLDSEAEHGHEDDLDVQTDDDSDHSSKGNTHSADESDRNAVRFYDALNAMSDSDNSSDSTTSALRQQKTKKQKSSTTSALPELSHAAYLSGSESEASDLDAEFKTRKNRRGQRARQKIAELKFGAKAKHLEKQERNKGWDPKRGAVSDDRSRRGGFAGNARNGNVPRGMKTGFGPQQSGENATPLGQRKKRDDAGTLHPSWQAAKLAKEKKQIKIDLSQKPAGKKVVFD